MSARIAAIDIGTVTTRLLVADVEDGAITEVERSTDITHLGEDLTKTGALSADAMRRVAEVIECYAERMRALGVERHTAMATSASRDAANGDDFLGMLEEAGVRPLIIGGDREAQLAFRGATAEREGDDLLVVDCGGGSTEIVIGDSHARADGARHTEVREAHSFDVGSKRMTERFLRSDPPSDSELSAAREWAREEMRPYFEALASPPREMIALAGTATTLAAIDMELAEYDPERVHGYRLSTQTLRTLLGRLAALPLEQRLGVVGLHPGRAGVIVAGTLIFDTVLEFSGLSEMVVSEHDILYGILLDAYDDLRNAG